MLKRVLTGAAERLLRGVDSGALLGGAPTARAGVAVDSAAAALSRLARGASPSEWDGAAPGLGPAPARETLGLSSGHGIGGRMFGFGPTGDTGLGSVKGGYGDFGGGAAAAGLPASGAALHGHGQGGLPTADSGGYSVNYRTIPDRLFEERILMLVGDVNESMSLEATMRLLLLEVAAPRRAIQCYVNLSLIHI